MSEKRWEAAVTLNIAYWFTTTRSPVLAEPTGVRSGNERQQSSAYEMSRKNVPSPQDVAVNSATEAPAKRNAVSRHEERHERGIIQTLVPARDRERINEGLNMPLLMQQLARGVADPEKLAAWLSSSSAAAAVIATLVSRPRGLCDLLSVLENIKLDVVDRHFQQHRPLLVERTAKSDFSDPSKRYREAFGNMAVSVSGLARLLLPSVDASQVPNMFLLDEHRTLALRSHMFDGVQLETLMGVYETAEVDKTHDAIVFSASRRLSPDGAPSYLSPQPQQPATTTQMINGDAWATSALLAGEYDFNTPPQSTTSRSPTSSRPSSPDFNTCRSTTSSPRNSTSKEDVWSLMAIEITGALSSAQRPYHVSPEPIKQCVKDAMSPEANTKKNAEHIFRERLLSALGRRVKDFKATLSLALFVAPEGDRIHPIPAGAVAALTAWNSRPIDPSYY
ncbi:cyclic-AMP-mediated signaling protein [Niveomyces insectorum RCEF 264]|uniref:Cyclic-AMP-mediated signaling protein n=1 Tax=Niveomyces insectorum RCEF 264 TaxID=1081102 RepID=A0A167NBB3_9HYPO|nr:cyclic-AMP-mediated signaling protein [Niveomyces insectorum RCEF 264]